MLPMCYPSWGERVPTIKFTDRGVKALKAPKDGRIDYWDATLKGFGLRVSGSGRKTWCIMYRAAGKQKRFNLGQYPTIALSDARSIAKKRLAAVSQGGDPSRSKKAVRLAQTFAELAEEYIEKHAKIKKKSWYKDRQALDRDILPAFGEEKIADVTRADVIQLLESIKDRGAPITANRTLEILRRIFNWGITRGLVEVNPCHLLEKPAPEVKRDKVLTDDEIRAFWSACEADNAMIGTMFKLRLITAQRGGEISRMRKQDIDGDWWTIPAEFSKNGMSHRVPLSKMAVELIAAIADESIGSDWVFPSRTTDGPIWSIWKGTARIRIRCGVQFRPHDLRRTVASKMAGDLRINRLVIGKILNHADNDITAVYDRHTYDREKREALNAWADELQSVLKRKPRSTARASANTGSR